MFSILHAKHKNCIGNNVHMLRMDGNGSSEVRLKQKPTINRNRDTRLHLPSTRSTGGMLHPHTHQRVTRGFRVTHGSFNKMQIYHKKFSKLKETTQFIN